MPYVCDRIIASKNPKTPPSFHATRDAEKCPTYMILIQPSPKSQPKESQKKIIKNANPTRPDLNPVGKRGSGVSTDRPTDRTRANQTAGRFIQEKKNFVAGLVGER